MTKIFNVLLYFIVFLLTAVDVMAQTDKVDYYSAGYYEYGGITLPYRKLDLHQNKDHQIKDAHIIDLDSHPSLVSQWYELGNMKAYYNLFSQYKDKFKER